MPDEIPSAPAAYPDGFLAGLEHGDLIAELGRQHEALGDADLTGDAAAATVAQARAHACQAELIRRSLIAIGATEVT